MNICVLIDRIKRWILIGNYRAPMISRDAAISDMYTGSTMYFDPLPEKTSEQPKPKTMDDYKRNIDMSEEHDGN